MTKAQFVREFTSMMQESYPSLTEDFVLEELDKQLAGNEPANVIGMFMKDNLAQINIEEV